MNLYQPTITGSLSVSGSVNISGSISIEGGGTISGTASIATTALTASFVENAQTASYVLNAVSSSFALTASSADNLLVRNTLTAQTLVVQTITSSVDFVTGSTRFGSIAANTHVFTGSISTSGSIGIGTSSPTKALEILSNTSQDGIKISGASNPRLTIIDTTNNVQFDALTTDTEAVLRTDTNHPLHLSTNGTLRLTIAASGSATFSSADLATDGLGNVNIFTTDAAATGRGGSLAFGGGTTGGTSPYAFAKIEGIYDGTAAYNGAMLFSTNNGGTITERMRITSGGSVQITANDSLLVLQAATVNKGIVVEYKNSAATRRGYVGYGGDSSSLFEISNSENGAIDFRTNAAFAMRITSAGNIGIGTSSPLQTATNRTVLTINATTSNVLNFGVGGTLSGYIFNDASTTGLYAQGDLYLQADGAKFTAFVNNSVERMRITSGGNIGINTTTPSYRLQIGNTRSLIILDVDAEGFAGGTTAMYVGRQTSTNRSINAAGTINASGADYAEYMIKSNSNSTFHKGDILGVDINGLLTDIFADSKSFVVKSTNPSYVGGDSWFTEMKPIKTAEETDEEYAQAVAAWEARYQEARKTIDRIAFSGQVPCNITDANVGDYIIPIELENGKICGQAITNPTFEQYQISVGKVWKIMDDGRAWIAVKIG
jgi:hypothetical protein